jgi:uncharacterized protein YfdQ (DUF2303 family)
MTSPDRAGEAQAIIETARLSTIPHKVEPGGLYVVPTANGANVVDLTGDKYRDTPARKEGTVVVHDVASFGAYYGKHADAASEVFADAGSARITAVLDAHSGHARWQAHRLSWQVRTDPHWQTWIASDGKMMSQQEFAEFIEDNAPDVAADSPVKAADLIELAQKFQATTKVTFSQGHRLASGETQLTYVEETNASAGRRGEIQIPPDFSIGVPPFEGGPAYRVKARFRYRISDGTVRLGYRLNRPEDAARDAFEEIAEQVETGCGATVMRGMPVPPSR